MTLRLFLTLLLTYFSLDFSYGQKKMSRDEIMDYFSKFEIGESLENDSTKIIRFNNDLENLVENIIDSLKNSNCDTIIVYSVSYPGYFHSNDCVNMLYPIDIYIIWKQVDTSYFKKIKNGCDLGVKKTNSTIIFDFYLDNYVEIKNDKIMPIIYNAYLIDDRTMNFSCSSVSHELTYSLNFIVGNKFDQKEFDTSEIMDKKSLFYGHNFNLKTFSCYLLIDNIIKEIFKN
jgi:hypothetical protein